MEAVSVNLDIPIVQNVEILGFEVSVIGVQLGLSARLAVRLNCILDGNPFMQYMEYVIEGDEYTGWGSDDNYVVELVRNKLIAQFTQTQGATATDDNSAEANAASTTDTTESNAASTTDTTGP